MSNSAFNTLGIHISIIEVCPIQWLDLEVVSVRCRLRHNFFFDKLGVVKSVGHLFVGKSFGNANVVGLFEGKLARMSVWMALRSVLGSGFSVSLLCLDLNI